LLIQDNPDIFSQILFHRIAFIIFAKYFFKGDDEKYKNYGATETNYVENPLYDQYEKK
jgi:hypothetical protein